MALVSITYACGCQDDRKTGSSADRCPIHDKGAVRVVVIGHQAHVLKYGVRPPSLPPGGVFRPNLEQG